MPRFEDILNDCLEGLRSGSLTLEACRERYPFWWDRLAPLLTTALELEGTLRPTVPSTRREQARRAFLNHRAAHRLTEPASAGHRTWPSFPQPVFSRLPHLRALSLRSATVAAAFVIGLAGFFSYAYVSSQDALPGQWQYTVKRANERVRLAFTFGDDARSDLRVSFAEERLQELERLAAKERPISEPVLQDLLRSTDRIAQNLQEAPEQRVQRVTQLAEKQREVLPAVEPLVEPRALDDLRAALTVSNQVYDGAVQILALSAGTNQSQAPDDSTGDGADAAPAGDNGGSVVANPADPAGSPDEGVAPSTVAPPDEAVADGRAPAPTADATRPAEDSADVATGPIQTDAPTIAATAEAATQPASPTPAQTAAEVPALHRLPVREDTTGGLQWQLAQYGTASALVPLDPDWVVSLLPGADGSHKLLVGKTLRGAFTIVILIDPIDGSTRIQARLQGELSDVALAEVAAVLSGDASVIQHIVESVTVARP